MGKSEEGMGVVANIFISGSVEIQVLSHRLIFDGFLSEPRARIFFLALSFLVAITVLQIR